MITEMITSGQRKQLLRVYEDGLDKYLSAMTKTQADQVLASGNLLQKDLSASLQKHSIVNKRFGLDLLAGKGRITFGSDFNPKTQIDDFAKKKDPKVCSSTHYLNPNLTSEKFRKVSDTPEIGKEYGVIMIPIQKGCSAKGQECLDHMRTIPGIRLFGAQGETYLQNDQPEIFPTGKYTVSFDEKDALWKDADGFHRVPNVYRDSDGDWEFHLGYFEGSWYSACVLVCFCDLDESSES